MDILGPKSGEKWGKYLTIKKQNNLTKTKQSPAFSTKGKGINTYSSRKALICVPRGSYARWSYLIAPEGYMFNVAPHIPLYLPLPVVVSQNEPLAPKHMVKWTVPHSHPITNWFRRITSDYVHPLNRLPMGAHRSNWLVVQSRNHEVPMAKAGWRFRIWHMRVNQPTNHPKVIGQMKRCQSISQTTKQLLVLVLDHHS